MFDAAELGHKVSKRDYAEQAPILREALLKAQYALLAKPEFPVILVIGGVDGAGKGETVNLLNEWMDPRYILTRAFGERSDEESERPPMWRYWRALPPKGRIGILFGSWYTQPIVDRVLGNTKEGEFRNALDGIEKFETMLAADGALILKFWFHLSKKAQRKRLDGLEADARTRWRVTRLDRERFKIYDQFLAVSATALGQTSTGAAPWSLVEGADANYRSLMVGRLLLESLERRLGGAPRAAALTPPPLEPRVDGRNLLKALDYGQRLSEAAYRTALESLQGKLALLTRRRAFQRRSLIIVFEGQDAAGKGSTIRRITQALDARHYDVIPVAAPTEDERAHPYLWRFWRHLPRRGRVTIFDRSWYGRVLVERVEGYCAAGDWMRAYHEINEFEAQLVEHGAIVLKFWLAITTEEQLRRFHLREETPFKTFKITEEDWRNREKWDAYERATCDMVERCNTSIAPWHLVPTEDKLFGRIAVLQHIHDTLNAAL